MARSRRGVGERVALVLLGAALGILAAGAARSGWASGARLPGGSAGRKLATAWDAEGVRTGGAAAPGSIDQALRDSRAAARAAERNQDLVLILAGLALGLTVSGLWPGWAERSGGKLRGVLLLAGLAVGVWGLAVSLTDQLAHWRRGDWTLGDDGLEGAVGPLADAVRAWRGRIPDEHAVILLGREGGALAAVAWALYPRPVYAPLQELPAGMTLADAARAAAANALGGAHPARWLIDLGAAARDPARGGAALARVPAP